MGRYSTYGKQESKEYLQVQSVNGKQRNSRSLRPVFLTSNITNVGASIWQEIPFAYEGAATLWPWHFPSSLSRVPETLMKYKCTASQYRFSPHELSRIPTSLIHYALNFVYIRWVCKKGRVANVVICSLIGLVGNQSFVLSFTVKAKIKICSIPVCRTSFLSHMKFWTTSHFNKLVAMKRLTSFTPPKYLHHIHCSSKQ